MKIRQEDNLILTNSTNEKKFTIQASAKAFQILSSALYSRKVEAIIRELGCNAADSHTQAGYPELPFVVHLPNSWEPEFYVEDYGIGLDADDVENIYTSYFTSTKTDSNDVTGGFGLGSKTPFSYCDSFNLRTRKNGIEYHFNAYINMQGEPATSLLSQTETTERNGVRVSVPVKLTDYGQFRNDASTVYKWFAVVPTIIGGVNGEMTIDNSKASRLAKEGSFWSEYSKDGWNKNSITAVMGNVAYHVPKVADTFAAHFNPSERKFFENNSLFIQFQIGDLDVAASRETISFDEDTEVAFVKRVKEVIADFCKVTQDKLYSEISTVQDAITLVESEVGTWANSMFDYNGQSVHDWGNENFINEIRSHIDIDDYYFARTRKGTVKRHALDYIGSMTFSKLGSKELVVLVGNDKGFQTMARQIVNRSNHYHNTNFGVLFIDEMPGAPLIDRLYAIFGDYLTFELASNLIAADKAKRKAERDAAKLLQDPTVRKLTAPRIGRESIRAKVFELLSDTAGPTYSFKEKRVITVDDVKDKAYLLLVERYNASDIRINHPVRANACIDFTLSTTGESGMYHFCRNFKIDMIIVIKQETFKKADGLIGANAIKEVTTVDVDFIRSLALRSALKASASDQVNVRELMEAHVSYGPKSLTEELVSRGEAYYEANPDSDMAKAIAMTSDLNSWDAYSGVPSFIRDLVSDDTFDLKDFVQSINNTTKGIYEALRVDYPMAFLADVEDGEELEDYIYYMNKLRELDLIRKPEPEEVIVLDPVFDVYNDDIPF